MDFLLYAILKKLIEKERHRFTTAGTGTAYTATMQGYTEYHTGDRFIIIPHITSTTATPTLNINGLGARAIKRYVGGSNTSVSSTVGMIKKNRSVELIYDGTYFIDVTNTQPYGSNDFATPVSVESGGTGRGSYLANGLLYASSTNVISQMDIPSGKKLLGQASTGAPVWVNIDNEPEMLSENPISGGAVWYLSSRLDTHELVTTIPSEYGGHGLKYDIVGNKFQYSVNGGLSWNNIAIGGGGGGSYKKIGYTDNCDYVVSASTGGLAAFRLAVSEANDGDTILVLPGIYSFAGNDNKLVLDKSINFVGIERPTVNFHINCPATGTWDYENYVWINPSKSDSCWSGLNLNGKITVGILFEGFDAINSTFNGYDCYFGYPGGATDYSEFIGNFYGCVFNGAFCTNSTTPYADGMECTYCRIAKFGLATSWSSSYSFNYCEVSIPNGITSMPECYYFYFQDGTIYNNNQGIYYPANGGGLTVDRCLFIGKPMQKNPDAYLGYVHTTEVKTVATTAVPDEIV